MKRCPACGDEYRKGRTAFLLLPTGELERKRVCLECSGTVAIRIVPVQPRPLTGYGHCKFCSNDARFCEEHRERPAELHNIASAIRAWLAVTVRDPRTKTDLYLDGRKAGLESALELVEQAAKGRTP